MIANKTWILILLMVGAVACGEDDASSLPAEDPADVGLEDVSPPEEDAAEDSPDPDPGQPWDGVQAQVGAWAECALSSGFPAECAALTVPLDWSAPEGPAIELQLKRAGSSSPDTELWWFAGGPGVTVDLYGSVVSALLEETPGLRINMLEPRGVGGSNGVTCALFPEEEFSRVLGRPADEWGPCIEELQRTYGDGLPHLTDVRWKALDYAKAIEALGSDARIVAYGASAGTFTVNAMLLDSPGIVDAVAMRGVSLPGNANPLINADGFDRSFRAILARCGEHEACAPRFEGTPLEVAQEVLDSIKAGTHCDALKDAGLDPILLGALLSGIVSQDGIREAAPAVIYRINRCAPQDIEAIATALDYARFILSGSGGNAAWTLEMYGSRIPEDWEPAQQWIDLGDDRFTGAAGARHIAALSEIWPWPIGTPALPLASYDMPMLIIHGELDPRTPVEDARTLAESATGDKTWLAIVPDGVHSAVSRSTTVGGERCGLAIMSQFVQNPEQAPDLSCLEDMPRLDFQVDAPLTIVTLFGNLSLWGDEQ